MARLTSRDLPPVPGPKRKPGDWHRSVPRWALEYHFARGDLAVKKRFAELSRVYDLPERVLPEKHRSCDVDKDEADRELLARAGQSLGVATRHDLADYYRMSPRDAQPRIEELVDSGELLPVEVDAWNEPAYLGSGARIPRSIRGASLLSPFDPVVWFRPRAKRLFDFHYRIEIYVPEQKREWGYYVLPFRMGDEIVARVDLKADRKTGTLLVCHAYAEEGRDDGNTAAALRDELRELSGWLELDSLDVRAHNAFSTELKKSL